MVSNRTKDYPRSYVKMGRHGQNKESRIYMTSVGKREKIHPLPQHTCIYVHISENWCFSSSYAST